MVSPGRKVKIGIITFCSAITILVPIGRYHRYTHLPRDPFWKYQSALFARRIRETGSITGTWFPPPDVAPLRAYAGNFLGDVASVFVVNIVSAVTGLPLLPTIALPLFAVHLIVGSVLLSYQVTPRLEVPMVAGLLGAAYYYPRFVVVSFAHRAVLAWALFFYVLSFLVLLHRRGWRTRNFSSKTGYMVGLAVLLGGFVFAYRTLVIAVIPFFIVVFLVGSVSNNRIVGYPALLLFLVLNTVAYVIVTSWGAQILSAALLRLHLLQSGFGSTEILVRSGTKYHPVLQPYTDVEFRPSWPFVWGNRLMALSAVGLFVTVVGGRFRQVIVASLGGVRERLRVFDVILAATCVHLGFLLLTLPLFPSSGGSSVILVGLMFTPILGARPLSTGARLFGGLESRSGVARYAVAGTVVVAVLLVPFAVSVAEPTTPHGEFRSVSDTDRAMAEWASEYDLAERVVSDLPMLSTYLTVGGTATYYPPPGTAYSAESDAQRLVDIYYETPGDAATYGRSYLVSEAMRDRAMFHRSILATEPNPSLSRQLSEDSRWHRVFDNGHGTAHAS